MLWWMWLAINKLVRTLLPSFIIYWWVLFIHKIEQTNSKSLKPTNCYVIVTLVLLLVMLVRNSSVSGAYFLTSSGWNFSSLDFCRSWRHIILVLQLQSTAIHWDDKPVNDDDDDALSESGWVEKETIYLFYIFLSLPIYITSEKKDEPAFSDYMASLDITHGWISN